MTHDTEDEAPSTAEDRPLEDILNKARAKAGNSKHQRVRATPFLWEELSKMPPREVLFGGHAVRGYLSLQWRRVALARAAFRWPRC
jgi:hypothetical protein